MIFHSWNDAILVFVCNVKRYWRRQRRDAANYVYRSSVDIGRCIEYRLLKFDNASCPSGPAISLGKCLQQRSCAAHLYFFKPSPGLWKVQLKWETTSETQHLRIFVQISNHKFNYLDKDIIRARPRNSGEELWPLMKVEAYHQGTYVQSVVFLSSSSIPSFRPSLIPFSLLHLFLLPSSSEEFLEVIAFTPSPRNSHSSASDRHPKKSRHYVHHVVGVALGARPRMWHSSCCFAKRPGFIGGTYGHFIHNDQECGMDRAICCCCPLWSE